MHTHEASCGKWPRILVRSQYKKIVSEYPEISINFVGTSGWDAIMFVYLQMHDLSIQIGQKDDQPFPPSVYLGPKFESVWAIGSIGVPLYFDKLTKNYTTHFVPSVASSFDQSPMIENLPQKSSRPPQLR